MEPRYAPPLRAAHQPKHDAAWANPSDHKDGCECALPEGVYAVRPCSDTGTSGGAVELFTCPVLGDRWLRGMRYEHGYSVGSTTHYYLNARGASAQLAFVTLRNVSLGFVHDVPNWRDSDDRS